MLIVGLTGSIGMGKSSTLKMFEALGIKTWSADEVVHKIYSSDKDIIAQIVQTFGDVQGEDGAIDRNKLGKIVLNNDIKLKSLEAIIHPKVQEDRFEFIEIARNAGEKYVVFDIPLLFETKSQDNFNKIIVVNCSPSTQKQRVLARPNMTETKFNAILAKQIPNQTKIKLADFVIDTNESLDATRAQVHQIHEELS